MDKEDKKEIVGMFEHISEKMSEGFEEIHSKIDIGFKEVYSEMEAFRNETSENFKEVRKDISSLRTDLDTVEQETESNKGFAKEIDTLFDEVKKVKEHIGLKESF